jgi:hypothetical protein
VQTLRRLTLGLGLALILATALYSTVLPLPWDAAGTPRGDACGEFSTMAPVRQFGLVHGCRRLGSRAYLFGLRAPSLYLLLDTDSGLVGVRLDYHHLDQARQYQSVAHELTAAGTPHLSPAERDRLRADIAARDRPLDTWTVHYGDG